MIAAAPLWADAPGAPARAADAPAQCSRATLGQLSCQAGVRCECTFQRESTMSDRPGGYQWDCGINRPPCDMPPATLDPWLGPYPSSVGIDRTTIYEYPPEPYPPHRDRDGDRDRYRDRPRR